MAIKNNEGVDLEATFTTLEAFIRERYAEYQKKFVDEKIAFLKKNMQLMRYFNRYIREEYNNIFSTDNELLYEVECMKLAEEIPGDALEVLEQLIKNGPTFDGDLVSKNGRNWLFNADIATRGCHNGEPDWNIALNRGWHVKKYVEKLRTGRQKRF